MKVNLKRLYLQNSNTQNIIKISFPTQEECSDRISNKYFKRKYLILAWSLFKNESPPHSALYTVKMLFEEVKIKRIFSVIEEETSFSI